MESNYVASVVNQLRNYKPLMHELIVRDSKVKYRRSFLGYVWSLLNPLMMMTIMSMVFSYMFRYDIPNYPLYLICGQTLWAFFSESTNMAMNAVLSNGSLIRKVYIPKYIFPVSRVLSSFVTMSFSLVAILIVMIVTGVKLSPVMLLFPIPLMLLLVFCMGIGLMLSAMSVYFRDITHLYGVLTMGWMYFTPIFYPVSALPEQVALWVNINPMYHYIYFFREVVLYGNLPGINTWVCAIEASILALVVGFLSFRKLQRNFILHL